MTESPGGRRDAAGCPEEGHKATEGEETVRVFLLLLVALAIGAFFTKPELDDHQKVAAILFMKGMATGGVPQRVDEMQNWYVASKFTTSVDGKPILECWGAFTRFLCLQPTSDQQQQGGDATT
jgi:hypothetical protein